MSQIRLALLMGLTLSLGCLGEAKDPRPLPPTKVDGSLFDARPPIRQPGTGSGYGSGSGFPGPSGPSGPSGSMRGETPPDMDIDGWFDSGSRPLDMGQLDGAAN